MQANGKQLVLLSRLMSALAARTGWPRTFVVIVGALLLVVGVSAPMALARDPQAAPDPGPSGQFMTAAQVINSLGAVGLTVQDVKDEPVAGSPSGPPATEQEAYRFTVAPGSDHPLTGRVLVFADAHALHQKAEWFRRSGVSVVQHRNVLVWLDSDLDAQTLAAYRQAVAKLP